MILLDASVLKAAYGRKPRGSGSRGSGSRGSGSRGSESRASESEAAAALRRMIESGMSLGIPAVALQEVLAGVHDKTQFQELHAHLGAFRILPATTEDHVAAARLAAECAAKWIPCTPTAALIVAQAASDGWPLYTLDSALTAIARMAGVQLAPTRETASETRRGKG